MSDRERFEILENAWKGIEFLQSAQVGRGPMAERSVARKKASDLLLPFVKVNSWPVGMRVQAEAINALLMELS